MSEKSKNVYDLELHESLTIERNMPYEVMRVPGGWIYETLDTANQPVFVPYSNEFNASKDDSAF